MSEEIDTTTNHGAGLAPIQVPGAAEINDGVNMTREETAPSAPNCSKRRLSDGTATHENARSHRSDDTKKQKLGETPPDNGSASSSGIRNEDRLSQAVASLDQRPVPEASIKQEVKEEPRDAEDAADGGKQTTSTINSNIKQESAVAKCDPKDSAESVTTEEATSSVRDSCQYGIKCYSFGRFNKVQEKFFLDFLAKNPIFMTLERVLTEMTPYKTHWLNICQKIDAAGPPIYKPNDWLKIWLQHLDAIDPDHYIKGKETALNDPEYILHYSRKRMERFQRKAAQFKEAEKLATTNPKDKKAIQNKSNDTKKKYAECPNLSHFIENTKTILSQVLETAKRNKLKPVTSEENLQTKCKKKSKRKRQPKLVFPDHWNPIEQNNYHVEIYDQNYRMGNLGYLAQPNQIVDHIQLPTDTFHNFHIENSSLLALTEKVNQILSSYESQNTFNVTNQTDEIFFDSNLNVASIDNISQYCLPSRDYNSQSYESRLQNVPQDYTTDFSEDVFERNAGAIATAGSGAELDEVMHHLENIAGAMNITASETEEQNNITAEQNHEERLFRRRPNSTASKLMFADYENERNLFGMRNTIDLQKNVSNITPSTTGDHNNMTTANISTASIDSNENKLHTYLSEKEKTATVPRNDDNNTTPQSHFDEPSSFENDKPHLGDLNFLQKSKPSVQVISNKLLTPSADRKENHKNKLPLRLDCAGSPSGNSSTNNEKPSEYLPANITSALPNFVQIVSNQNEVENEAIVNESCGENATKDNGSKAIKEIQSKLLSEADKPTSAPCSKANHSRGNSKSQTQKRIQNDTIKLLTTAQNSLESNVNKVQNICTVKSKLIPQGVVTKLGKQIKNKPFHHVKVPLRNFENNEKSPNKENIPIQSQSNKDAVNIEILNIEAEKTTEHCVDAIECGFSGNKNENFKTGISVNCENSGFTSTSNILPEGNGSRVEGRCAENQCSDNSSAQTNMNYTVATSSNRNELSHIPIMADTANALHSKIIMAMEKVDQVEGAVVTKLGSHVKQSDALSSPELKLKNRIKGALSNYLSSQERSQNGSEFNQLQMVTEPLCNQFSNQDILVSNGSEDDIVSNANANPSGKMAAPQIMQIIPSTSRLQVEVSAKANTTNPEKMKDKEINYENQNNKSAGQLAHEDIEVNDIDNNPLLPTSANYFQNDAISYRTQKKRTTTITAETDIIIPILKSVSNMNNKERESLVKILQERNELEKKRIRLMKYSEKKLSEYHRKKLMLYERKIQALELQAKNSSKETIKAVFL